jgi:hypothetical protein
MKYGFILFLFVLAAGAALAQGPDTMWTRTCGGAADDLGYDLITTSDGNFVIAGATSSYGPNPGTGNAYVLKVNGAGDTLWTNVYGGDGGEDVDAVHQTSDGGYILAGYTSSLGAAPADCYLLKLDAAGTLEWARNYGGTEYEEARAVQQTSDGGYILVGYTTSFGVGTPSQKNVYIVKTNSVGDTAWTRTYGGINAETAFGVEQTADEGYMVAGLTGSYGAGSTDAWLLRLDASGDTLWTHTYGGPGGDGAYWLARTNDGGYAMAGYTASYTPGINDQYLLKVDAAGTLLWARHYGGADHDQANCVQQTTDGGYVLSGITKSFGPGVPAQNNYYVVKTNSVGDTLWTRVLGGAGNDVAYAVRQTTDEGYAVAGYTRSFGTGAPSANVYLVRYSGWPSVPQQVVVKVSAGTLILNWADDNNPYYRIYSAATSAGPFATLEASTSDTTFTIVALPALRKFYVVVGSTVP